MDTTNSNAPKNAYWWIPFMSGLILLIFGIWFLLAPLDNFKTLSVAFGFIVLLTGVLEIFILLKNKNGFMDYLSFLWGGILNVVLGILLIANPRTILVVTSFIIGFWMIFKGGEQIKRAFNLKKNKNDVWKRVLSFGIILILIAAILLWHPEIIGFTIALWTSIAFILIGIFRIYLAFQLKALK
ncbi:MAG: HdeD family acid-resistance protein [Draconibacterium sp.]